MSILKDFLDFAGLSAYDTKIKQIINSKVAKIKMNNNTLTPDSSGEINLGNIATTSVASDSADGLMSKEDYTRLKNVAAGAEVNVQSDWNQTTTTADDYIKNKPTLGTASAKDVPNTGNASTTQVVMGSDTRLSDSRNAKDVSAWAKASTKPSYTASEVGLGNVGNFLAVSTEANQELSPTQQSNARANIGAGTSNFSGSYNDLSNKPTIPTVDSTLSTTSTNAIQNKAVTTELNKKANSSSLATVATSGSYNDLSNKPTIPTVNNGTLTIQKNGTEVQTFTANQGTNAIANITVPTKTSDLTNDSGFEQNVQSDWNVTDSTSDAYIKNKPSIPTIPNGFANIKVGTTTVAADTTTDTVELAGSNVTLTPDATNDKITIGLTSSNVTAALGYTPYDSTNPNGYTNNVGTITGIKMNGSSKGTSGVVDLGTVITDVSGKVDKETGKGLSTNDYTTAEKNKLAGIASGAEVNQNAFSTVGVKVGDTVTNVSADSKTDTVTLIQGSNVTLTPDSTNDTVTISAKDTTYSNATTSTAGLMSASDKTKLNGIAEGATANVGTITGITMNGASKGTSGVVNLGTVITDVSGKADKSATVSTIAYDETNHKLTKTINGTTTDITVADATVTSGSNKLVTSGAVFTAIDNLPEPMVFKGTVGDSSVTVTWANLPAPSASNEGYTYKATSARTTSQTSTLTQNVKSGDTIISNKTNWVVIPSGDEPSGTVTSVATGTGLTGGTITTSGTISHADTSSQGTVTNSGRTYIQSVELDGMGHVTKLTSATETVVDTNTHRPIQVNDTEILGNNTTPLNLKAGSNVSLTNSSGTVTINASQPTVNNGTLTIQKNGSQVATFTANQSGNSTANITVPTTASDVGALPNTTKYAGSASVGGAASSLAGFTNTTTTATAIDNATQNGHVYVSGTSDIYNQSDGAAYVQAYSTSWVGQIYQDYRTGQIALRGKNNGTWQDWRKVWDSKNLTNLNQLTNGPGYITASHTHSFTPAGTISSPFTGSAVTSGAPSKTATVASSDHTHTGTSGGPNTNGTATVGSSDHTHSTTTGGPNSGGTVTVAAQNHTHSGTAQIPAESDQVMVPTEDHTHTFSFAGNISGSFTGSAVTSGATGTGSRVDVSTAAHAHSVSVSGTSGGPSGTTSLPNTNHTHSVTAAGSINSTFTGSAVTSGANSGSAIAALLTPTYDSTAKSLTFSTKDVAPNSHTHSVTAAGTIVSTFTGSAVTSGKPDTTNVTSVASSGHTHTTSSSGSASADSTNKVSVAKGDHTHSVTAAGSISGLVSNSGTTDGPDTTISVAGWGHEHEVTVSATGTTGTTVASSGHTHTGTSGAPSKTTTVANSSHTHTTTTGAPSKTATVGSSDHTHSVTAAGTVNSTFTGTAANTGTAS